MKRPISSFSSAIRLQWRVDVGPPISEPDAIDSQVAELEGTNLFMHFNGGLELLRRMEPLLARPKISEFVRCRGKSM